MLMFALQCDFSALPQRTTMKHRTSKAPADTPLPKRARPLKAELETPPSDSPMTSPAPDSPYLTAEEAGKYLRVFHTAHAMQQATKRYGIPHIRVGKHILYQAAQLDEFMAVAT